MNGGETLQALFVVLVPEIYNSIASNCRKGSVTLVETNAIDGIDIVILPMTLECKRFLPVHFGHIVNSHPPLDASHGIARRIRESGDASTLEFQRTFLPLMLLRLSLDIVRYNMPPSCGDHHQTIPHIQIVTFFGKLERPDGVGLPCIPKFKHFVPPSGNYQIGRGEEGYGFDGLIVRTNLLRDVVGGTLTQLPHPHGLICPDGEDGAAIGGEARV